jgi:hypothetical protein
VTQNGNGNGNHSPYGERDEQTKKEPTYDFRDPASKTSAKGRDDYGYIILRQEDSETIKMHHKGTDFSFPLAHFTPVDTDGNPLGPEKSMSIVQVELMRGIAQDIQRMGGDLELLTNALLAIEELANVGIKGIFNGRRRKSLSLILHVIGATKGIFAIRLARERMKEAQKNLPPSEPDASL